MNDVESIKDGLIFYRMEDGSLKAPISGGGPGDDEGAGGSTGQPQMSEIMDLIKKQNQMIIQLQQENSQNKGQFDELVEAIAAAVEEDGSSEEGEEEEEVKERPQRQQVNANTGAENQEVASLRRELQKQSKQMEELQKVIQQRESAMEEERELRLASQRDSLLSNALQEAGVLPTAMEAAIKLFRDNVAYDEEKDEFVFMEEKTGVQLPIVEGVKDNMPDYLKASNVKHGGSGGRGSQPNALLEQARSTLSRLETQAKKSGLDQDIAQYHAAKKQMMTLETQRQQSSGQAPKQLKQPQVAQVGAGRDSADESS